MQCNLAVDIRKIVGRRLRFLVRHVIEHVSLVVAPEIQSVYELGIMIDLYRRCALRRMTRHQRRESLNRKQAGIENETEMERVESGKMGKMGKVCLLTALN